MADKVVSLGLLLPKCITHDRRPTRKLLQESRQVVGPARSRHIAPGGTGKCRRHAPIQNPTTRNSSASGRDGGVVLDLLRVIRREGAGEETKMWAFVPPAVRDAMATD